MSPITHPSHIHPICTYCEELDCNTSNVTSVFVASSSRHLEYEIV